MVNGITNFEFLVGIAAGKILLGALLASPLFRSISLALAGIALVLLYLHEGIPGILAIAHALRGDVISRPDFSKGVAVGAATAFVVFGIYRTRAKS
jgi:hypothetical protein